MGFEPMTFSLATRHSTTELRLLDAFTSGDYAVLLHPRMMLGLVPVTNEFRSSLENWIFPFFQKTPWCSYASSQSGHALPSTVPFIALQQLLPHVAQRTMSHSHSLQYANLCLLLIISRIGGIRTLETR